MGRMIPHTPAEWDPPGSHRCHQVEMLMATA